MSKLKTAGTCPLGSECEEVRGDTLYTCHWYVMIKGQDAQGNIHDTRDCAIKWMPILQIETANQTREVGAGVESMRNENTTRQNMALQQIRTLKTITNE